MVYDEREDEPKRLRPDVVAVCVLLAVVVGGFMLAGWLR